MTTQQLVSDFMHWDVVEVRTCCFQDTRSKCDLVTRHALLRLLPIPARCVGNKRSFLYTTDARILALALLLQYTTKFLRGFRTICAIPKIYK